MDSAQRLRATYAFQPVDHLYRREFYIWSEALERWRGEGMPADANQDELFGFDPPGSVGQWGLGWCEPPFVPAVVPRVLETTGDHEIALDKAGRTVKYFKGRRHGFMPTYLRHAVTCDRDWDETVAPLLSPETPERWATKIDADLAELKQAAADGKFIRQHCIGGYMYLRALVGPEEICYLFLDNPGLVHKMMRTWLELADRHTARVQQHVELDEFFIGEDICYNHGLLISPEMVRRFLFPYYQQILANVRSRQQQPLHFHVDTDGNCAEAIDLFVGIGMDKLSPVEIAANNDVLAIARKYPGLVLSGGIDKRVLADGPGAIDDYLGRIMPYMVSRGGFYPTCDHGVPDNVSYASYMHYRRRMMEMDH